MDLETENRIAVILLKEAAELRRQAQNEGALAYLREPTVRSRPNSRFLTATIRGVQQANRVVEVIEMWRLRKKQIELDDRIRESRYQSRTTGGGNNSPLESCRKKSARYVENEKTHSLSRKDQPEKVLGPREDEGLREDEVGEFLQSRVKRGRGAVGSKMDETGPYLPSHPDDKSSMSKERKMKSWDENREKHKLKEKNKQTKRYKNRK